MSRSNRTKKSPPDILSAAYLEGASGKKDELLRRLTNATELLSSLPDDDESHHQHTHPNLLSFASTLVSPSILHHRDPDVRLGAILAILELFYIYAPNPPWSNREVILIFRAIVRQLENLQHCDGTTTATGDGSSGGSVEKFEKYFRILEQLSEVKIGVVLVDMIRTERDRGVVKTTKGHSDDDENGDDEEDDDNNIGEYDALETLCELLRTLLSCVRVDHPPEVAHHAEMAVLACIEEFEGGVVPIQVLEELLVCVGKGPVIWVANPAYAGGGSGGGGKKSSKKKEQQQKKKKEGEVDASSSMPPPQIQQTNASYLVAARVLRRAEDKVSSPIAALLNGLLAGDSKIMGMSSLSASPSEDGVAALFSQGGKRKRGAGASTTNKKGENDDDDYEEGQEESSPSSSSSSPLAAMDDFLDSGSTSNSSGTNVYSISYELHRIAPQILTTVIGTISSSLVDVDVGKRFRAAKLLGRLFAARGSDIASRFVPCFREWLRRSYDPEPKIRETMVKCLTNFLSIQHAETDLCADVNEALSTIIVRDPNVDIRLAGIHQVCNLAHTATTTAEDVVATAGSQRGGGGRSTSTPHPLSVISTGLLKAVGNRVSSKNKTEHKDAITGLAQIYHKHYIRNKLRYVQEGGDDASTDEILEVWKELKASRKGGGGGESSEEEEKLAWIPQRVFECVSFPDNVDPEMRNRIFQIVDDVLLGTAKKDTGSTLSATSRAVGLAIIVNFVKEKENAYKWMCALFTQRSCLQKALGVYLDARSKARDCESGSPEAFAADAEALERLEVVASLSAPLSETGNKSQLGSTSASELESILKKFHAAKDKHIFRILSTIASPVHSPSARLRAFDELPKRTKGLGSAAQSWVKMLARRCAMGAFLNAECIEHCIMLSQECFEAGDCEVSALFLDCIKMATSIFPSLGSTQNGFQNLVEFFDVCRTSSMTNSMKREMEKYGVVTMLSEILARCGTGPHPASSDKTSDQAERNDFDKDTKSSYDTLHEQLLRLCTRDGTPEQAKNSVYTISSMIKPKSDVGGSIAAYARKEIKEFDPLLKALVNPSRLYIPDDNTNLKSKRRIVSILSAIAAIAECAPYAFNKCGEGHGLGWGARSIEFALDRVLLGKSASLNSSVDGDDSSESDDESLSPAHGRRASKNAKGGGSSSTKSSEISVHCEMLCGAIEVLVSHIRSTVVHCRRKSSESGEPMIKVPSPEHISKVFTTLTKIIEDGGIPPSSVNGRYCKTIKDQAFLRRSAAVNLLRLCDANLQLEATYLTPRMWHILSSALLDKDTSVRASVMEELAAMYTGRGKFRALNSAPMAPSLRFVSLVTLCADGDGQSVKNAATSVIKQLRTTCQSVQAQCRQQGRNAEKNFENRLKMLLMPEYSVPYALHLLVFRKETALAAGTLAETIDSDDEGDAMAEIIHTQEASQKTLKKRLKWLFDPLIQSLGSGADNISFLMRMIELIGKHPPVNVLKTNTSEMTSLETSLYVDEDDMDIDNNVNEEEAMARMKIICQFAREVLLSHVKKDVNLTLYPGSIQFPGGLYSRPRPSTSPVNADADDESEESTPKKVKKPKKSISYYVRKNQSQSRDESAATKSDNSFEDENLEDDDQSIEKDELEVEEKSEEDEDEPNVDFTGGTYDSVEKNELEVDEKSEEDEDEPNIDFTGDTYDPSSSFSPSPSPHPHDNDEFDKNLGDMSPIAKTNSPAVDVVSKGRKKSRSSAPGKKSTSTERKRKLNDIDIFDEFPTPALSDGVAEEGNVLSASPTKKRKSTPKSGSSKKSKATPVSVPTSVLINVTNSTTSSARSGSALAGTSSRARKTSKKSIVATRSIEEEDDDFNFSDSPVKAKAKTTAHSRKKAALAVSSGTNTRGVASKAKAPAKAKATKAKVFRGTQSSSSPSTTTEASSRVSPVYRGGKRGARPSRA